MEQIGGAHDVSKRHLEELLDVCWGTFKATSEPTHSDLPTGHHINLVSRPGPHSSQQCPAFPSSLLVLSQTPSFTYFSLKTHGRYHLAKTVFPASCEHPASRPLECCASVGLVSFIIIQVSLKERFNCRLTYIDYALRTLKIVVFMLHFSWCFAFAG